MTVAHPEDENPAYRPAARPAVLLPVLLTALILLGAAAVILSLQAWQNPDRLARQFAACLAEGNGRALSYLAAEVRGKVPSLAAYFPHRLAAAFRESAFREPKAAENFFSRTVDITVAQESGEVLLRLYFTRTLTGWKIAYISEAGG